MNVHDQEGDPTTTSTIDRCLHFLSYDYETFFNMKMTFFNGLDKENIFVHLISMTINLITHIDNVH